MYRTFSASLAILAISHSSCMSGSSASSSTSSAWSSAPAPSGGGAVLPFSAFSASRCAFCAATYWSR